MSASRAIVSAVCRLVWMPVAPPGILPANELHLLNQIPRLRRTTSYGSMTLCRLAQLRLTTTGTVGNGYRLVAAARVPIAREVVAPVHSSRTVSRTHRHP